MSQFFTKYIPQVYLLHLCLIIVDTGTEMGLENVTFWFSIVFVHSVLNFFIKRLRHYSVILQKKKHTNYTVKNV